MTGRYTAFRRPARAVSALAISRLAVEWWLVLMVSAAALAGCIFCDATMRLDNGLYDFAQRHAHQRLDPRILLVTIDNRSLAQLGPWPWPRSHYARLLDQLHAGGTRAVALDLLLLQPADAVGDAALAQALGQDGPIFLPVDFQIPGSNGASHDLLWPLPAFRAGAAGLGHVNLAFDADGVARRIFLTYQEIGQDTRDWPQLVSLMARSFASNRPHPPAHAPASTADTANTAPYRALVARNPVMIPYVGPQGSIPQISAASVLAGEVPPAILRGRLVLIGAAAGGLGDAYGTPVDNDGSLMPGIEIQANLLNALLTGSVITPASKSTLFLLSLLPLLLLHVTMRLLAPRWTLPMIALLFTGVAGLSGLWLLAGHIWLPPGAAMVNILALYPFWTWRRLASVSGYMSRELEKLDRETDPLERPRPNLAGTDPLERQMGLLRSAINREHDLRSFLVERIAQMPDTVLVTDNDGRVVLANAGARRLYAELIGRETPEHVNVLLEQLFRQNNDNPQTLAPFTRISALATPFSCRAYDQAGRTYDIRCEPQHSASGGRIGFVIRIVDTTAATLMQRQREDVLQFLSHDMRSPQASILALLDRAPQGAITGEMAATIRNFAWRTLSMADGFVHLSRAELMPITPQELDFASLIQDATEALWPQAQAKGITFHTIVPDDTLIVHGDPSLLARALTNIIDNALKFSPADTQIWVHASRDEHGLKNAPAVICRVIDEGPGIPADQMSIIFERFRRAPAGPMHNVAGNGLGLAFVHTVASRHGGQVYCDSEIGHGTCFTFAMPLMA